MIRSMKNKYSARQWLVLLGASLFQCAMMGILVNSSGVLFAQIRQELGMSMTKVSAFNTIKGVSGMLSAAYITGLFFKMDKAKFLLCCQTIVVLSFVLLIWGADGWLWYFTAVLNGAALCVSAVAVPYILAQWFPQNAGFAAGVAMAFSGISGAICNPMCAKLILSWGWKVTILIMGALTMLITIPGLYLMFRWEPDTAGKSASRNSSAYSGARQTKTFLLLAVVFLAGGIGVQFSMNMSMYAQSIGYSLTIGASLTTMIMIGNVASKFLYGCMCDALGTWKSTGLVLFCAGASVLCLLFASNMLPVMYGASLIYGSVYALSMIGVTRCAAAAYGEAESKRYLGLHTSVNNGVSAAFSLLAGVMYDSAQSFVPVLVVILSAMTLSFVAVLALARQKR